jgi:cysteinyl-tRNA synthetase
MTGAHYRSPLAFSEDLLKAADSAVKRLDEFAVRVAAGLSNDSLPDPPHKGEGVFEDVRQRWDAALNDDLNLPTAVGHLFEFVKQFNSRLESGQATQEERAAAMAMLRHANRILDVIEFPGALDADIDRLIQERQAARDRRDFKRSDEIRQQLVGMGIQLDDTKEGTRWKRIR